MTPAIGHKQWVVVRVRKEPTEPPRSVYVAAYGPFDSEALASAFAWSYGDALKTHLMLIELNAELA